MALPTVTELVEGFDQKRQSDIGHAYNRLINPHGIEKLIPRLIKAFGEIQSWRGRNSIMFDLIRFARTRPDVLQLAVIGLKDSAFLVRMQSCIMMAYSQRKDMIPHLKVLLDHEDAKTRNYAKEAIKHLKNKTVFYEIYSSDELKETMMKGMPRKK